MVFEVTLRKMIMPDSQMVMDWRNTPFIYERGFSGQPVTKEDHSAWMYGAVFRHQPKTYIIMANGIPCGNIRFHYCKKTKEDLVSIYLEEKYTGKGIGPKAITMACEREFRADTYITAEFLPENYASKSAFKKAGFRLAGKDRMVYFRKP